MRERKSDSAPGVALPCFMFETRNKKMSRMAAAQPGDPPPGAGDPDLPQRRLGGTVDWCGADGDR